MWKKLLALGAVLAAGPTHSRVLAWGDPPRLPGSVLPAFRSSAADPSGIGRGALDFSHPFYATPLPPGAGKVYVPHSGPLAAPIIMPVGTSHGRTKFIVVEPGEEHHPTHTKHPERLLTNEPGPCERYWMDFEFLYWATQGPSVPALVSAGSPMAAPGVAAGLGQPTTDVLFGNTRMLNNLRPGMRLDFGTWFDSHGRLGLNGRFYFLGSVSEQIVGGASGVTVLNAPQVFNVAGIPVQVPTYVGFPGLTRGTVSAAVQSNFLGGDINLRHLLVGGLPVRMEVLAGYRYMHLGDHLDRQFDVVSANAPIAVTPRVMGEDSVRTRNNFHGVQAGFIAAGRHGPFSLELQSFFAMGVTAATLDVSRTRLVTAGAGGLGALAGLPGGTVPPLVQTEGSLQSSYFAVVPEVGVKVGWHPADHVRFTAGYSFIYWSRVRRAQEQFDLSPTLRNDTTDVWAQGINIGMELRY